MHSSNVPPDSTLVRGISLENDLTLMGALDSLGATGFQATNVANAIKEVKRMLEGRQQDSQVDPQAPAQSSPDKSADPILPRCTIYLGAVANLFASGVRESLRFVVQHHLVDVIVVSGGAMEHDIRRVIEAYHVGAFASEVADQTPTCACAGNVEFSKEASPSFRRCLDPVVETLIREQQERVAAVNGMVDPENDVIRGKYCSPSVFWQRAGELLPQLFPSYHWDSSVVYWAARHHIPIYSPSFSDGDIVDVIRSVHSRLALPAAERLVIDLTRDIHSLNRSTIRSPRTGMIILGGGVVKHHICNANLMRNGADHSVFINCGQEFDGSDAGARPDEAVSWGKIRVGVPAVKVYAEVSVVFPLVVAGAFLPFLHSSKTPLAAPIHK